MNNPTEQTTASGTKTGRFFSGFKLLSRSGEKKRRASSVLGDC
jgi:hypothetical protein